jgi:hypothetical protein
VVSSSIISETQIITPNWQWNTWEDLPYLTCSLLQNWQHGFFTQQFYPRTPEELIQTWQSDASVYRLKQIHGNQVLTPTEITTAKAQQNLEDNLVNGDAILSDEEKQSVWVASADCNPVLIGDINTGRVAAIHAGWRGTAQKIVPKAIARFLEMGSLKENLRIAIGPAIAGECYQVTEYVAAQVGTSIIPPQTANTTPDIISVLQQLPNSPLLEDSQPGRVRLDIRQVNAIQIEQLGINLQQIAIAPFCTYQQTNYFFSYRRSQEKKVQWSGIVSKK